MRTDDIRGIRTDIRKGGDVLFGTVYRKSFQVFSKSKKQGNHGAFNILADNKRGGNCNGHKSFFAKMKMKKIPEAFFKHFSSGGKGYDKAKPEGKGLHHGKKRNGKENGAKAKMLQILFDFVTAFSAVAGTAVAAMFIVTRTVLIMAGTMFIMACTMFVVTGAVFIVAMFMHSVQSSSTWEMPVQRIAPTWASSKE